jgi:hypothetical protein
MERASLQRAHSSSSFVRRAFDMTFATLAFVLFASLLYDLLTTWAAPRCQTPSDLDLWSWCLPIGWAGPFADAWATRSFFNARVSATTNIAVAGVALGCAFHFLSKHHPRARAISYICGFGATLILIVKAFVLNDMS